MGARNRPDRKVLCSIGAGRHEELLAVSGETFRAYAAAHGYDLELRTELLAPERPASWSKVALVRELITTYDVVFWVDADAAIVDVSRDVLDDIPDAKLLALVRHRYDSLDVPNCGVMVLRSGRRTRRFLDRVWASTQYVDHEWWENAAVLSLMGFQLEPCRLVRPTRLYARTHFLGREWNSMWVDEAEQPRINHYPGFEQEYRLERLRADLETLRSRLRV
jgi:hypothetical protein